ncbi:cache type 2 domain-containing protein [Massilia sp. PAMC28688]|uniref:cache type 2 domain-containing protein n=1 Tax=Massilia sp. PAMC28688 TaxID=2861283 RepID=UPI001C630510|nr:cache type 2 domain-containing protein [Massilia sp. PAMC28688]QYF95785.1 cache type 2 domain-containing protein [Massilia sp. PAMC28688]
MKTILLSAALLVSAAASQAAAPAPTEQEARAMAARGAALIKAKGREEMVKRIHAHDPEFVQEALALTMRDLYTGVVLAHPVDARRTGTDNAGTDPATRLYPRQVIELAQRSGQGRLDQAWIVRVGDVVLEAGLVLR